MGELTWTRLGIGVRVACGVVALVLYCMPLSDAACAQFGITGIWDQPSNYFFGGIAAGVLGMLAPHFVMQPGALKLWRRLAFALCLVAALLNTAWLVIRAVLSIGMNL